MIPKIHLNRGKSGDPGLMMTPLIDIMFLITIFFVLTSSFSQKPAFDISLPQASTGSPALKQDLSVFLKSDGRIFVNEKEVTLDSLVMVLQDAAGGQIPETLLIQGDQTITYNVLIQVMDRIRALGWENISLVTEKVRNEG